MTVARVVELAKTTELDELVVEEAFTETIVDTAKTLGWTIVHFRPARTARGWRTPMTGDRGFPDLVLAHERWRLFAMRELKTNRGRLRPEQKRWIAALTAAGVDVGVWRPRDWGDLIDPFLKGKTRRKDTSA